MRELRYGIHRNTWENALRLVILLVLGVVLSPGPGNLEAQTVVGGPEDYPTIQGTIDAASNGDTDLAVPGTSVENIFFRGKDIATPVSMTDGAIVTAGNTIYRVHVVSVTGHGAGLYTATTGPDHPAGPGLNVLFGNAVPWTTFNTIRSYTTNTDYVQGDFKVSANSVVLLDPYGTVTPIGTTGFRTTYVLPGPPTTPDALTIIVDVNVNGSTFEDASIEVTTTVMNNGDAPVDIGIRYLWDYQIGSDDDPTFQEVNPDGIVRVTEAEFPGPRFESYRIEDNDDNPDPPTFFVFGTVTGPTTLTPPPSAPDLLQYVSWPDAYVTAFEYDVTASDGSINDSAVNYFFGPDSSSALTIPPQGEQTVSASVFAAPVIECQLSPDSATGPVGSNHTVTVSVTSDGSPVSDTPVTFTIVSGPNAGMTTTDTTDPNGQASFTYTGSGGPGSDTVEARGALGLVPFSCTATQTWTETATSTPTPTDIPVVAPTPTATPASSTPKGKFNLTARVFVDYRCDRVFQDGVDIPLRDVPVTLAFPDGSSIVRRTIESGMVNFAGFDATEGVRVSADLPQSYAGYALGGCAHNRSSVEVEREDFNAFRYHYVAFGIEVMGELAGP